MDVAGKRAWILTTQRPLDRRAIFIANYWPVVALVLKRYEPAALAGLNAIKFHLEELSSPEELLAYQCANQSKYALLMEPGFVVNLRPRAVPVARLNFIDAPGGARIPVLSAADILTNLEEREINAGIESVSAWLRHLVIPAPDLDSAVADKPKAAPLQRYVPPNPKKIRDLIGGLERFAVRKDLSPIACALLVHLEFVTIHPFMDGHGRLGRLLMNQVLLSAGLPWVTIRSDERVPFFKGIEQAQVDGDATSFIRFVWHLIQQSATDLSARQSRRKTARR